MQLVNLESEKEASLNSNRILAEENLAKEPELIELRSRVNDLSEQGKALCASVQEKLAEVSKYIAFVFYVLFFIAIRTVMYCDFRNLLCVHAAFASRLRLLIKRSASSMAISGKLNLPESASQLRGYFNFLCVKNIRICVRSND